MSSEIQKYFLEINSHVTLEIGLGNSMSQLVSYLKYFFDIDSEITFIYNICFKGE